MATTTIAGAEVTVDEEGFMTEYDQWNEDIAPIYPKTPEGQAAPLMRIDIHDDLPEGLSFASALRFTPTFVLMQDGQEIARIEGYPGEEFFWGLLQVMLDEAGVEYSKAES